MPRWSQDAFVRAYEYAARMHQNQKVPGGDLPYITHVSLVSMEVIASLDEACDGDLAVQCALLHDVLEDTASRREELVELFGPEVTAGVEALTKDPRLDKGQRMEDSLRRIKRQPREIWMVKMADRITNLRRPPDFWSREKRLLYREEAALIHAELSPASEALAARLRSKIVEYGGFIT